MPSKKAPVKAIVPIGGKAFPSVRKARAKLMERAEELFAKYISIIEQAAAAGDYETAAANMRWLLEHMPEEDGQRMIEISVDKPKQDGSSKPSGPAIQVGIAIGGVNPPKHSLPSGTAATEVTVIDINDPNTPPNS